MFCIILLIYVLFFRETTLVVYALSLVGMVVFTFTLSEGIAIVYLTSALLGYCNLHTCKNVIK